MLPPAWPGPGWRWHWPVPRQHEDTRTWGQQGTVPCSLCPSLRPRGPGGGAVGLPRPWHRHPSTQSFTKVSPRVPIPASPAARSAPVALGDSPAPRPCSPQHQAGPGGPEQPPGRHCGADEGTPGATAPHPPPPWCSGQRLAADKEPPSRPHPPYRQSHPDGGCGTGASPRPCPAPGGTQRGWGREGAAVAPQEAAGQSPRCWLSLSPSAC